MARGGGEVFLGSMTLGQVEKGWVVGGGHLVLCFFLGGREVLLKRMVLVKCLGT